MGDDALSQEELEQAGEEVKEVIYHHLDIREDMGLDVWGVFASFSRSPSWLVHKSPLGLFLFQERRIYTTQTEKIGQAGIYHQTQNSRSTPRLSPPIRPLFISIIYFQDRLLDLNCGTRPRKAGTVAPASRYTA